MPLKKFARVALAGAVFGGLLAVAAISVEAKSEEVPECKCRASLRYSRPQIYFSGGELKFVPRFDIRIRSRGSSSLSWTAKLKYEGETKYHSEDVAVPEGVSFSGEREVFRAQCGSRFKYKGYSTDSVMLTSVNRSLVGEDEELDGVVKMKAQLSGCDIDESNRYFPFRLKDIADLRVRGWKRIR